METLLIFIVLIPLILAEETSLKIKEKYYEIAAKLSEDSCQVLKKIGGHWESGFLDGEKAVCMDGIFKAIQNRTCLVYLFGLSDNWDFEVMMANLGK